MTSTETLICGKRLSFDQRHAPPSPPGLHRETTRHGKTVWYVRPGKGHRVRIHGAYGTPEFWAEYRAALTDEPVAVASKAPKNTLGWLWELYRQSSAWMNLALATRKQRENIMLHVLEKAANTPLAHITKSVVQKGRERRAETPSQAKNFVSTIRAMFVWAVDSDVVDEDPTRGLRVSPPGRARRAGFPVWTEDDIRAFEVRWPHGTRERVMFDIFLYTGLRRGDAARLGRQHIRDGVITIDTEKTGMRVTIPILPQLKLTLDAGPTGDLALIATAAGHPMTKESVGNLFRDACRAAGVAKAAHGLRKAAATNAANHGATVAELEAIFGWSGGQMASLYTRSADRRALATKAISKLARTETETSIPAPDQKVRASAPKL